MTTPDPEYDADYWWDVEGSNFREVETVPAPEDGFDW